MLRPNFGLCDSISHQKRYDEAISYCQQALAYDPTDPSCPLPSSPCTFVPRKYNQWAGSSDSSPPSPNPLSIRQSTLNPDTNEAANSRKYHPEHRHRPD